MVNRMLGMVSRMGRRLSRKGRAVGPSDEKYTSGSPFDSAPWKVLEGIKAVENCLLLLSKEKKR